MVVSSDFVIIGAGIVGLSTALELKKRFPQASITILEKEPTLGKHASGRNSGVLHSGIYYGSDTLKAKVCSKGAMRMMAFAEEHGVPCRRSGKVIIASGEHDLSTVERLLVFVPKNWMKKELKRLSPMQILTVVASIVQIRLLSIAAPCWRKCARYSCELALDSSLLKP